MKAEGEDSLIERERLSLAESLHEHFEILEAIGKGGMATVFRAINKVLDLELAIKILNKEFGENTTYRERFLNEAKYCSQLKHPNIVQINSFGLDKTNRPYIVMEFLKGETLDQFLKGKSPISTRDFEEIFFPVLEALDYAHSHNLIHRDLKPSNIFVSHLEGSEKLVKILDFGIAKRLDNFAAAAAEFSGAAALNEQQLTVGLLGSPLYMSPEQAAAQKVDHRSDLYSIACIMFEAIDGRVPFESDNAYQTIYKKVHEEQAKFAKPFNEYPYPKQVLTTIISALNKAPEARPASAKIFLKLLKDSFNIEADKRTVHQISPIIVLLCVATILAGVFFAFSLSFQNKKQKPSDAVPVNVSRSLGRANRSSSVSGLPLREAEELREAKKLDEAILKFKSLLINFETKNNRQDLDDIKFKIHRNLAEIYAEQKKYESSEKEFNKAIALAPPDSAHRLAVTASFAEHLSAQGRNNDAKKLLLDAITKAGDSAPSRPLAELISKLGKIEERNGNLDSAAAQYEKAINIFDASEPRLTSSYAIATAFNLYSVYQLQKQTKKASAVLNRTATELEDYENRAAGACSTFAMFCLERPELKAYAIEYYKKALKHAPNDDTPGETRRIEVECRRALKELLGPQAMP